MKRIKTVLYYNKIGKMRRMERTSNMNIPLTDAVIVVIANLVDDAKGETRKPSHYNIGAEIERAGLSGADPKNKGMTVGKAKKSIQF